jgi:hypothetical protein
MRDRPAARAVLVGLGLILALTACTGRPAGEQACTPATAAEATDAIGLTASEDFTSALALAAAAGRPGDADIEWMPVYSVSNLTGTRICVHDITLAFPRNDVAGMRVWLESIGPSRGAAVYHDLATLRADAGEWTTPVQPLPFTVAAHSTVMVRLVQAYRFMVDGTELELAPDDTLADYVGPYLGLEQISKGGRYHCGTVFSGMQATVEADAGRSTHEVSHVLMPAGCVRVIPSR